VPTVARINVTPVKGTKLHHPEVVQLSECGIEGNRRLFLCDERGDLLSGFDHGQLATVEATIDGTTLTLRMPDGARHEARIDDAGPSVEVVFDQRRVSGRFVAPELADVFSTFVGRPVRLVRADREGDGPDVHRLTVVGNASVEHLARGGGHDGGLDVRRFRMNFELDGCAPYEEDTWGGRHVRVGGAVIEVLGQVPRCRVTEQAPVTGVKDWDTLRQIARQRSRMDGGGLPFGVYAEVVEPGLVAVGDAVAPA